MKVRVGSPNAAGAPVASEHPAVLVLQLDAAGRELRRVRHDFAAEARLLAGPASLTLVEDALVAAGQKAGSEAARVHFTTYVSQLVETGTRRLNLGTLDRPIDAAQATAQGEILLAGCDNGSNSLLYVDPSGRASALKSVGREGGMQECDFFAIGTV